MEPEVLTEYLRSRLPARPDLQVTGAKRVVGGMSRETWFVDFEWNGGTESESVTFRIDHEKGAVVPVPLEFEFRVHQALHGTQVPVAEPYWFEHDKTLIGQGPFYVRELVEGTASPKYLYAEGQEALRESVGLQFAELLGKVHTLDWNAAGVGDFMEVPELGPECALLELRRWQRNLAEHQSEPLPVAAQLFAYLEREAPTDVERVALVWGDVGIGNFIFRNDNIVALTDWEQSHLGDPMKDWASALWRGVDNLLPREKLFEEYERTSGIPVNLASIDYYLTFIDAEYVCTSHPILDRFTNTEVPDVTFARLGMGIPWYCMDHGMTMIGL